MSDLLQNHQPTASERFRTESLHDVADRDNRPFQVRSLTCKRLRANPMYEFVSAQVLHNRIGDSQVHGSHIADLAGILRLRAGGGTLLKGLRSEMARLYLELQEPGYLSGQVRADLGEHCDRVIAVLVLDRVLEIEQNGQFVSGASSYDLVCEPFSCYKPVGRVAQLSMEALEMAQILTVYAPHLVASRLYHYNRIPASADWLRRLANPDAIADFLGITSQGTAGRLLGRAWQVVPASPSNPGWLSWCSRYGSSRPQGVACTYKLYVSPNCEFLPETFATVVDTFTQESVPVFKVGCDMYGLLRPDKLVAYFWERDAMFATAARLQERLIHFPAHGVPFTSEIAGDGILSWGMDPPDDEMVLGGRQESWRSWLVRRIAAALIETCEGAHATALPWQYVLARLELDGVDTQTWTPTASLWN